MKRPGGFDPSEPNSVPPARKGTRLPRPERPGVPPRRSPGEPRRVAPQSHEVVRPVVPLRPATSRPTPSRSTTSGSTPSSPASFASDAGSLVDQISPDQAATDVVEPITEDSQNPREPAAGQASVEPASSSASRVPGETVTEVSTENARPLKTGRVGSRFRGRMSRLVPRRPAVPEGESADSVRRAVWRRRRAERAEMKRFTAASRRRRRTVLVSLAAVGGLVLFVAVGAFTPLMGLREVQVVGAERLDTAAVETALFAQENVPLTLLDEGQVEKALTGFPLIQSYSLETLPPHTLVVRVVERQPVMSLAGADGFTLVDPAGVVVETQPERPAGFPLAESLPSDPKAPAFVAVTAALRGVPDDLLPRIETVTATTADDVSFILAESGIKVVWGSAEDSAVKGVILDEMIAALATRQVSVIDVSSTETPVFS